MRSTDFARRRSRPKRGFTLLEVTIALAIVSTVLMASAGAFLSSIKSANVSRQTSRATVFLETVLEDVSAQPYDNLLAFNGNKIYDEPLVAQSNYTVDLSVFLTSVDLLQISATLTDLHAKRVVGRVTTYRSRS